MPTSIQVMVLALLAITASALPAIGEVNNTQSALSARDGNYGVYYCTEPNWGGKCQHSTFCDTCCFDIPKDFVGHLGSIGTDTTAPDTVHCYLYENCEYPVTAVTYPGVPTLAPYIGQNTANAQVLCNSYE